MKQTLLFQDFKQQTPVSAYIIPGQGVAHLVIHGPDNQKPWHDYSAPTEDMARLLNDLLHQVRAILSGQNHLSENCPAPSPCKGEGWGGGKSSKLTVADLAGLDDETALILLIEHFKNSEAKIYNTLLTDYYTLTKRHYHGTSDADLEPLITPPSPRGTTGGRAERRAGGEGSLHRDLKTIRPHLSKLIQNGQLVRGHQTRIAEILKITNAGATNRQRILKIVKTLEAHIKKNSSTTSTTTDQPPQKPLSTENKAA